MLPVMFPEDSISSPLKSGAFWELLESSWGAGGGAPGMEGGSGALSGDQVMGQGLEEVTWLVAVFQIK